MLLGSSIERLNQLGSGRREEDYYHKIDKHIRMIIFTYQKSRGTTKQYELPVLFHNKWIQSIIGTIVVLKKKNRPDIIRTKQFWGAWSGWIIKILTGAPLVIRCGYIWSKSFEIERSGEWRCGSSLPGLFEKWLINKGDAYIFSTKEVEEYYLSLVRRPVQSLVIPNAFNLDTFNFDKHTNWDYDYIYVGRLIELKNVKTMLNIIPKDKDILVIGSGKLDYEVKKYNNATLISKVDNYDLPKYFNKSQCFISMSKTEGNPKSVYEGIICGAYPILSDIPAHRRIIEELGYGTLVHNGCDLPDINFCKADHSKLKLFRSKYNMINGVEKEIDFLKMIISKNN